MLEDPPLTTLLHLRISTEQAEAIDRFQAEQSLASRADTARLLIEIALDSVNSPGRRFWDRAPGAGAPGSPPGIELRADSTRA